MIGKFFSYIVVGFLVLVSYLPLSLLYIISDIFYLILYYVIGYRKNIVRENLNNSFPDKSKEELLRIEKEYYKHLADIFVEVIKYRTISKRELNKRCKVINHELITQGSIAYRSFICVQAHYANWEWVTHIDDLWKQKVLSVYKPLHNKAEDKFMLKIRERFGAIGVPKNHIIRVLARRKKAGELSAVGLLSDQMPHINKATHWMTFLNQNTPVFLGAEKMAKMFDIPVVYAYNRKIKRGYYEIEFRLITDNPKDTAPHEITEKHMRLTEQMIKEKPQYWMWSHRRWKIKRSDV
ncbi:KDO2-lipid IV(A) lauroyltransferase [Balneicella halophila]|uniref:KDO2-lipid IV(A) lauroyltransferase n=1 Tax=Balneicella halophila TaxID=1537566 RepID=A0A7L4UQM7_BALHA|nr:lysophospholipid acyltransferase family protein [Balneicella halophila]PVX52075.1 KDO2-lipid IV(A) lauroyltransferase [Balneicella halophila]